MVRPRPLVTSALLAVGMALVPAPSPGAPTSPAQKAVEPLDRQPYRIRVLLRIDPEARVDASRRDSLVADWLGLVQRFVGAPWRVEVAAPGRFAAVVGDLETLRPEALEAPSEGVDKVWVIRLS
ncbi:MAG: hypothetical protein LC745_13335, partial [Planctomycetia bacterium]|nr:hypothetical protein [Planctomycetia bacterium]